MQTKLIALEVSLLAPPGKLRAAAAGSDRLRADALRSHIQAQLAPHGDPLRWAITAIDNTRQTAHIEAVVTVLT
ncbi:MAG: hypothetical protein WBD47_02100 [Phormidesmis sp.]